MDKYTTELATDFNFPHIDIYRQYCDGEFYGFKALAQEGYVFYDTEAKDTELEPETMVEIPVINYYTIRLFPKNYNMSNFTLKAVPKSESVKGV